MQNKTIASIIYLLSIGSLNHKELALINELNNLYHFDNVIFLFESSVDKNRFINLSPLQSPQIIYTFENTGDNIFGLETLRDVKSKNIFMVVASASSSFESNLKLLIRVKQIQQTNTSLKIGIFFSQHISSDDLEKIFKWFWNHRIIHVFVAAYSCLDGPEVYSPEHLLNIFAFNPFGSFTVINLTATKSFDNLFLSLNSNFQKYNLRVGLKRGNTDLSVIKLWQTVFFVLNASITLVDLDFARTTNLEPQHVGIDLIITTVLCPPGALVRIYPLTTQALIILVPEALPYPEIFAYLKAITSDVFFGYALITIVAVIILLTIFRYMKLKKIPFFQSATDVLNLLLNDNEAIIYSDLSRKEVCLIVPLTFAGFIIVNVFFSILKSYLTRPIIQPSINTVEDLYQSPFPILTANESFVEQTINMFGSISKHDHWNNKFSVVSSSQLQRNVGRFNMSMSFITSTQYANVLMSVQKRLNIRGYHIFPLYIDKGLGCYMVNKDFRFTERCNEIIHRIWDAGLYDKWLNDNFNILGKHMLNASRSLKYGEKTEINTSSVPVFIVYGWLAGLIVFFIEIIWKYFKLLKK